MSDFEIDFEWPVAKYEFQPAPAEEASRASFLLSHGLAKTDWPFYFGSIVQTSKATKHRPTAEKMKLGVKALVEYKDAPFHLIALKVARALGALSPKAREGADEEVLKWHFLARSLRQMFQPDVHEQPQAKTGLTRAAWPPPRWTLPGGHLGIYLLSGKDGKPILALRPDNLSNALKLYAARMIATGTTFNICEHCRAPFLSGGTRGRNKRGDARFCSSECRWKWHNETRRKAR